jgi:RND family efflux transporter MFP subunit
MFSVSRKKALLFYASVALLLSACGASHSDLSTRAPADKGAAQAAVRVRVARATAASLDAKPQASGLTRAFQRAAVAAEVSGRVLRRSAEPGDRVLAGAPLLELDQTRMQLAQREAEAGLLSRQTDLAEATRDADRGDELASQQAISDSERDRLHARRDRATAALRLAEVQLARAQQNLRDTIVRAPFDGIVESVDVDPGEFIPAGAPVALIVNLERVRLRAGLTANEANRLRVGDPVQVVFDAGSGRARSGAVQSIGQVANPGTGTFAVEIWLPNPDLSLRDGMTATIEFNPTVQTNLPLIPRSALARSGSGAVVFVVQGDGEIQKASRRSVRLGRSDDARIEVLQGIEAEELVVIDGHFALQDGSPVLLDQNDGA